MYNLTPWELTAYASNYDYRFNIILYEYQYKTKKDAEETAKLIKTEYPKAIIIINYVKDPIIKIKEDPIDD